MKIHPITVSLVLSVTPLGSSGAQARLPGQVVDVRAGEFFIQAPDTITSGLTTFRLTQVGDIATSREKVIRENLEPASATNDPTRAFHMLWVVRLDSGHSVQEWYAREMEGKRPAWAVNLGGPSSAEPPLTTNATMTIAPGNYVLVCYVGSARQDLSRHHLRKGMFRALTVVAGVASTVEVPPADIVAVISGAGRIALTGAPREGVQTIRVVNETPKAHEFSVVKVLPGRSAEESVKWTRNDGTTHPFAGQGGFSDVPPGATRWTTIQFSRGTYVLWTTRSPETSVPVTVPAQ